MSPSIALLCAIVAMAMLAGMVLGYRANTRAALWRRRFEAERAFYLDYRQRVEARLARRGSAGGAPPVPPAPVAISFPPAPPLPLPIRTLPPVAPAHATREIMHIVGIDAPLADRLEALGVTTIHDLATLTQEDELALELRLGLNAGTIARDQWRSQAQLLDGATPRFGDLDR